MDRFYSYVLGTYEGRVYHLTVSGAPSMNDVDSFAVTVHYDDPVTEETVEIARIDTSHGFVHLDKLYRADRPKEPLDLDAPWEAEAYLSDRWRRYAERYERNHE